MLSSPEILIAGASVVDTSGGRVDTPPWPGVFGPTGVQEQGAGTRGPLGNLRAPSVSTDMSGSGTGIPTPRSPRSRVPADGSKQDARVVSPNEGNEVRRDGRTGVGASRSTNESGEPFRGTRWRERSEANCLTSGCKSRRRRSPCGAVVISGSPRGDPRIGSPEVKALDGQVGTEPLRSGQHRGQATRRAVAKANGSNAEIGYRTKLI